MWDAFINLLTNILSGIHGFCGDWGLAIIILTLIVRLLIMPLMTRSTRSSAKMQVLQPKMMELQERYADDPETLQREMSKFYAENKFNPLGGCLP
ncbi:MAG: YidC/Oxa1 family membrane protein insertase, partial [Atopobiaceae bacterium]|nr:YidC/Oxa1 family membrane protein insertase [Atopobiaceae bacterium]